MGAIAAAMPASLQTSEDLLADFERTGSPRAFEEVVRRHADAVYSVCHQVTKNAHDAEDATQAVFLTLAVHARTSNEILNVGAWLVQVARRTALDLIRSRKRRRIRETNQAGDGNLRFQQEHPAHIVGMHELKAMLRDEIGKLPAKYRLPLILHYFGGMKSEEMSAEMKCRPKTLAVRLYRARKLLGDQLRERGITIGGSLMTVAVADAILSALSSTFKGTVGSTVQAAGPLVSQSAPLATAIAFRVLRIARTCAFATRSKFAIIGLLIVSATMANPVGAVKDFISDMPGPQELLINALRRLTRSLTEIRPQFRNPAPKISSSAPSTNAESPVAVAPPFTPPDFQAWNKGPNAVHPMYTEIAEGPSVPEARGSLASIAMNAGIAQPERRSFEQTAGPVTLSGRGEERERSWSHGSDPGAGFSLASTSGVGSSSGKPVEPAHLTISTLASAGSIGDGYLSGTTLGLTHTADMAPIDFSSPPIDVSTPVLITPEPSGLLILGGGATVALMRRRRRRRV
jgi:RNA polymerase sigma factor (sigma-70 family)